MKTRSMLARPLLALPLLIVLALSCTNASGEGAPPDSPLGLVLAAHERLGEARTFRWEFRPPAPPDEPGVNRDLWPVAYAGATDRERRLTWQRIELKSGDQAEMVLAPGEAFARWPDRDTWLHVQDSSDSLAGLFGGLLPPTPAPSDRPGSDDPYAIWTTIGLATEVQEIGSTEVRGTRGVAYAVTVPVDRAWLKAVGANVGDEDLKAAREALGDVLRIDVVLDQLGRPLSLHAAGPAGEISFAWWDYDKPLDLQLPPESDVEGPAEYFGTATNGQSDTVESAAARLGGHELFTSLLPADATPLTELYCHAGTAWDGADCQMTYATGMSLAEVQRHYRGIYNGRDWQGLGDNRDGGRYIWRMAWRDETYYVNISIREPEEWLGDPVPAGTQLVVTATLGERN